MGGFESEWVGLRVNGGFESEWCIHVYVCWLMSVGAFLCC